MNIDVRLPRPAPLLRWLLLAAWLLLHLAGVPHHKAGVAAAMVSIARRFDPTYDEATLEVRPSKGSNYVGLTITITATSREQLDELYRTLSTHPMVKVVL